LAGIFINPYFPLTDGILGIVISIFIFHTSYSIFKEASSSVLGESPDKEFTETIKKIANESAGFDLKLHHFHMHHYGRHKEITYHICLPSEMTVNEAHDIADKLEADIYEQTGVYATTHIDPDQICKFNKLKE
jgi:divalent metal cation (Fe/Co/Zn/Cd) transporter